jgi:hypothetical protein
VAALAELEFSGQIGTDPLIYLSIGYGVGAGIIVNGRLLTGLWLRRRGRPHHPATRRPALLVRPARLCRRPDRPASADGRSVSPAASVDAGTAGAIVQRG